MLNNFSQKVNKKYDKYIFTNHAYYKMQHYRLSESLVKRVIRYPIRIEEGILKDAVACMRPAHSTSLTQTYFKSSAQASKKRYSEIWTMYVIMPSKQIKIITAWRYPGKSPERNPVPLEVIEEARRILEI